MKATNQQQQQQNNLKLKRNIPYFLFYFALNGIFVKIPFSAEKSASKMRKIKTSVIDGTLKLNERTLSLRITNKKKVKHTHNKLRLEKQINCMARARACICKLDWNSRWSILIDKSKTRNKHKKTHNWRIINQANKCN